MTRSRVEAGGHLAVPQEVLADLTLKGGDIVEFIPHDGGCYLLVPRNRDVSALKGLFSTSRHLSVEDMNDAAAAEAAKAKAAGGRT